MGRSDNVERLRTLADEAFRSMKAHSSPPYPRSYEVWFAYATGDNADLNAAVRRVLAEKNDLSGSDLDQIYDTFLMPRDPGRRVERSSAGVLAQIDHVMDMIGLALGSSVRYGESLVSLSHDLSQTLDRSRIRGIVADLVLATRDAAESNKALELRLKETRHEVETLRQALDVVRADSLTDALTGIANRKHAEEMLVRVINEAAQLRAPLSLIMIDIDHFKHFNDTWGHLTGDQVLRLVAQTMREAIKTRATLARFGGEEFLILLPDAGLASARDIAERQRLLGRELIKRSTGESLGRVTISLGAATLRSGDTALSLLERADHCMLTAKRLGRNRTVDEVDPAAIGELSEVA